MDYTQIGSGKKKGSAQMECCLSSIIQTMQVQRRIFHQAFSENDWMKRLLDTKECWSPISLSKCKQLYIFVNWYVLILYDLIGVEYHQQLQLDIKLRMLKNWPQNQKNGFKGSRVGLAVATRVSDMLEKLLKFMGRISFCYLS